MVLVTRFLSICLLGTLLSTLCSSCAKQIQPRYEVIAHHQTFTMQEFCPVNCDSFYVLPPYGTQQLDSLPFAISQEQREELYAATISDRTASILFIHNHKLVDYAIIEGGKADFRNFPSRKSYPMQQCLVAQEEKDEPWPHIKACHRD